MGEKNESLFNVEYFTTYVTQQNYKPFLLPLFFLFLETYRNRQLPIMRLRAWKDVGSNSCCSE
jgi:hypothetical protein